jgi:hypothetical protein
MRRPALARQEGDVRGECGVDEGLALEELVGRHEDAPDELEAKDRLPEGTPDRGIDDLGTLATQARPSPLRRLPGQPIKGTVKRRLGKLCADV